MAEGGTRPPVQDGGQTMQLDAIADDLEEVAPPPALGHGPTRPPPLPPKKTSKAMVLVGVAIVLLATALGIGAGAFLMSASDAPEGDALRDGAGTQAERGAGEAPAADEDEAAADEADETDIVQIDEVVVGAE